MPRARPRRRSRKNYRTWTTAYLRDRCANRQDLLDAVALLRLQKEAQTIPVLEAFVKNRPLDLYAGNAQYFLNYARFREGDYREAINGYGPLVNASGSTSWQGKAHYFLGRSYQLSGVLALAIKGVHDRRPGSRQRHAESSPDRGSLGWRSDQEGEGGE